MWASFIVIGIFAAACAWLIQRGEPRYSKLALSLFIVIAVAGGGFYFLSGPATLGPEHWWEISPWREMTLFVSLLLGMAIRYLTKAIEERREKLAEWRAAGSSGNRPGIEVDKWEFAYPLLVSAITFGTLLSQIKNNQLTMENVLLSFQTGFFWQTLLAARLKQL